MSSKRLTLEEKFRLAIIYKRLDRSLYQAETTAAFYHILAREFNDGTVPKRGKRFLAKQIRKILADMRHFASIVRHVEAGVYLEAYRIFKEINGRDFLYWKIIKEFQDEPEFSFY